MLQNSLFTVLLTNIFLSYPFKLFGQVINDDIENRVVIHPEEILASSTANCTVQYFCVDERLTGKCIKYYNDQWFVFNPTTPGNYFINIISQKCRDTQGIQLVVLTGELCQPTTYKIHSCTSLGNQDDVFVKLSVLETGVPYYFNVDGYLKDDCRFKLMVSSKPLGIPVVPSVDDITPSVSNGNTVLTWSIPDSSRIVACRILRRKSTEYTSTELARLRVSTSTYGTQQLYYSYADTVIKPGRYVYQVVSESTDGSEPTTLLLNQYSFNESMPYPDAKQPDCIILPLDNISSAGPVFVIITDAQTLKVLRSVQVLLNKNEPAQKILATESFAKQGTSEIIVNISYRKKNGVKMLRTKRYQIKSVD